MRPLLILEITQHMQQGLLNVQSGLIALIGVVDFCCKHSAISSTGDTADKMAKPSTKATDVVNCVSSVGLPLPWFQFCNAVY